MSETLPVIYLARHRETARIIPCITRYESQLDDRSEDLAS
jgi:hypothetical protein